MFNRPVLLKTSAALFWAIALATGFDGISSKLDGRIFLLAALGGTIITLQITVAARIDATYKAMAAAFITRPADTRTPGPWPAVSLHAVPPHDAQSAGRHRQNGHAVNQ